VTAGGRIASRAACKRCSIEGVPKMRIGLLEDDPDQVRAVKLFLETAGHRCVEFDSSDRLVRQVARHEFDLLILDWMVPGRTGLDVLKWVRSNHDWRIPVLFMTQRNAENDIVEALQHGADDYMVKPVRRRELLARLDALGRRAATLEDPQREVIEFGPFRIDRNTRRLFVDGEDAGLTQKEFDLAVYLFNSIGRVISRNNLLESVWGTSPNVNTRTVDTHVSRIRAKLGFGKMPEWRLTAVYQHGYRLEFLKSNGEERASGF
jgi:two-component system, OmpR family, response regulator RegX3